MKTKLRSILVTFSLLLMSSSCINIGKSYPSLIGTWVKKSNNFQIEMKFKDDHTTSVTVFDLSKGSSEQVHTTGVWDIRSNKLVTSYTEKYTRVRRDEHIINTSKEYINVHSAVDYLLGNLTLRLNGEERSITFIKRMKPVRDDSKQEIDNVLISYTE